MLKRWLALFLIVALIGANFQRFFVYAGFEANRSYIAQVLCENKARPFLHCNGRCYLMKKMKQAEEKEKNQEKEGKWSKYQDAFLTGTRINFSLNPFKTGKTYPVHPAPGICDSVSAIFQPPQLA